MVPQDDFTPFGYLDNPYHSWKLNPGGVLRSLEPLGMGWHVPNLGSYVNNQFQYTAHLTIGLQIGKTTLITLDDFRHNKCIINSSLHTKNRFEYSCVVHKYGLTLTARYFLAQEHVLGCILTLSTASTAPLPVTCYFIHLHTHNPNTSRAWEHGLYALQEREQGYGMLGIASEGDVFTHGARAAGDTSLTWGAMGFGVTLDDINAWAQGARLHPPAITQREQESGWQLRSLALPCSLVLGGASPSTCVMHAALARGVSLDQSLQMWQQEIGHLSGTENKLRSEDEEFWQHAPQLSGDWPASWRRGFNYDFETLRMIMRPPAGIIPHPWDGMQIQAPRTVLAEAAMDVLFLSYADPDLAASAILGHFEASPRPNLPCMREDGSFNMVADDGQICGTAPEWGYPLWCCDQLFRRTGNRAWLRRLYPGAAAYLRWWLEHRSDGEGWLGYACSWESGQDVSTRFGTQQTGGSIIQHVRPVDLQASMAQGAALLSRWATLLADEGGEGEIALKTEADWWQKVANDFTTRTRLMWHDGWFRDYDSVAREWSAEQDAMHLSPVFCGVADRGHIEQLRPALAQPPSNNPYWRPLSWPPILMMVAEAARTAAMLPEAAELAYRFIDASYRSIDSRARDEYGNIPGITRENRRLVQQKYNVDYVNSGIEGYGWGALSIFLVIRYIMGLQEEEAGLLSVAPMLPQPLRRPGASYKLGPLPWGAHILSAQCTVKDASACTMHLESATQQWQWESKWGEARIIALS
ncbi:MAG TPA: trehalase family glycosidase [Ktedonobacteraceae bacterium]|nr:trehalase family glycosidase [Ktedonobacteraceae bacterium]